MKHLALRDDPQGPTAIIGPREHAIALAKLAIDFALQPIVEINTGHVYGYEALMRGFDRLQFDTPFAMLDAASRDGQLIELEKMLQGRAIAKFASVPDIACKKLFLNLDGRTLPASDEMIASAARQLKAHRIPPSAICIELSERHNHASTPDFARLVRRLQRAGVRLAIDDFGVGHSEFKLLCDYGLDYVKVDGHFIRGISDNHRKRLFVSTITNLAHLLGIRVVAEGVETEADYVSCREAGCDLVQGYFVARPTCEPGELLPIYSHVAKTRARHRSTRRTDALLVRGEMIELPTLQEDTSIETVFEAFRKSPKQSFFPVVGSDGVPRGIIHERDLKQFIYLPFGRDLLHNKTFERGLTSFITACPIVDINTNAVGILEIFANAQGADGVIVTENLQYVGVLSAAALLKIINEKQLQQAQDQNPLTELPGNLSITDHVALVSLDDDHDRHFCYFDFDNFKPFNDRYGFQRGDRAITLFAALMRRHLPGSSFFLGHIGGDDFFAGCSGQANGKLKQQIEQLVHAFRSEVRKLYSEEDQRSGKIVGTDRDGQPREFELMRCSVAVLELRRGILTNDLDKIDITIAQAKSEAKRSQAGIAWRRFAG
jgi:diguanylate cyclase (GGDEF)-like protein